MEKKFTEIKCQLNAFRLISNDTLCSRKHKTLTKGEPTKEVGSTNLHSSIINSNFIPNFDGQLHIKNIFKYKM